MSRFSSSISPSAIVALTVLGLAAGVFRPADWNPWGWPLALFLAAELWWSAANWKRGSCYVLAGEFALLAVGIGYAGSVLWAILCGISAVCFIKMAAEGFPFTATDH